MEFCSNLGFWWSVIIDNRRCASNLHKSGLRGRYFLNSWNTVTGTLVSFLYTIDYKLYLSCIFFSGFDIDGNPSSFSKFAEYTGFIVVEGKAARFGEPTNFFHYRTLESLEWRFSSSVISAMARGKYFPKNPKLFRTGKNET